MNSFKIFLKVFKGSLFNYLIKWLIQLSCLCGFTLKDAEAKDKFVSFGAGENGLSVTRGWKGCKSIEMYESREDSNKIVIWQEWESKEDQESYIAHRHEWDF